MGYYNFRNRVTEMFPSYEFWLGAACATTAGIIAVLFVKMCENKRAKTRKGPIKTPEENDERSSLT